MFRGRSGHARRNVPRSAGLVALGALLVNGALTTVALFGLFGTALQVAAFFAAVGLWFAHAWCSRDRLIVSVMLAAAPAVLLLATVGLAERGEPGPVVAGLLAGTVLAFGSAAAATWIGNRFGPARFQLFGNTTWP